jgi:hypothetical protein
MSAPAEPSPQPDRLQPRRSQMLASLCITLLAATSALLAAAPLQAGEQDPALASCRAEAAAPRRPARPVVVIDDPSQPLDAKDPYYTEKLAARYRRWVAQVL